MAIRPRPSLPYPYSPKSEWAEGLYYNSGMFHEVLVYHDGEAIYFEHLGKESSIVRFTFEMIEGLKIVEEEESADSQE